MSTARELIIMGCGGSVGVPAIGCETPVCLSDHPRNQRTRTGVFVPAPDGNFVIDTSPELRIQLIRERVKMVHAALFTHSHADHIFGLDDLRICGFRLGHALPLYCEEVVEQQIRQSFNYAFQPAANPHYHSVPKFTFERIEQDPFEILGQSILPIRLIHGQLPILGFRINDFAFCTDASAIPEESWSRLEGLDVLVLGALRDKPHPTHFNIEQAITVVERLRPRQTFFTHLSTEVDYEETNRRLPAHIRLAYDGLKIPF